MLLGIDTCGNTGTVALVRRANTGLELVAAAELEGKTYSAMLVTRIRELLGGAGTTLRELEAVVVVHGPGSFTGVRVGLTAAKGIAEAIRTPVVAISRLKVLASKTGLPFALLDAGRGEFYLGSYQQQEGEVLATADEVREAAPITKLAVCEEKAMQEFAGAQWSDPPTAFDAIRAAMPRILAVDFDDVATLDGNYLRRSDAELFAWRKSAGGSQSG